MGSIACINPHIPENSFLTFFFVEILFLLLILIKNGKFKKKLFLFVLLFVYTLKHTVGASIYKGYQKQNSFGIFYFLENVTFKF